MVNKMLKLEHAEKPHRGEKKTALRQQDIVAVAQHYMSSPRKKALAEIFVHFILICLISSDARIKHKSYCNKISGT